LIYYESILRYYEEWTAPTASALVQVLRRTPQHHIKHSVFKWLLYLTHVQCVQVIAVCYTCAGVYRNYCCVLHRYSCVQKMIAVCYTCICVYRKPQMWQIVHNRLIICYIKLNQSLFQTKL